MYRHYADAPDPELSVPAPYEIYNIKSAENNPNMLQCELVIYMTCIYSSPEQSAKDSYPVLTDDSDKSERFFVA